MPWLIAVVFAEGFGFRSVYYWFAVGGAIGAAAYAFTGFYGDKADGGSGIAIHLAAGFVGGFAYWLIAGRSSGQGFVRPGRVVSPRGETSASARLRQDQFDAKAPSTPAKR